MTDENTKKLFSEFPPVATEVWEEIIHRDLKGADYGKKLIWRTIDGIDLRPYYRSEDLAGKEYLQTLPGNSPFIRGNEAGPNDWKIRQDIRLDNIAEANKKSLFVLDRGITSLGFICPPEKGESLINTQDDLKNLLEEIFFECIDLNFVCGHNAPSILEMLKNEVDSKQLNKSKIYGAVDFDPLSYLTRKGNWNESEEDDFGVLEKLIRFAESNLPNYKVLGINGYFLHNAGASLVQELGYSLAMAADYLARLTKAGISADSISQHMQFNLGVGPNYFMEIAKLRATRYLWAKLVETYPLKSADSKKADIHSITSEWNQTIYDPYVNVLRATTESMAAVIGGTNALTVRPFTFSYKPTSKFSGRIARNIQIILKEEAYLGKVSDPAAGSYYIENITEAIIEEAWNLVLKVEEAGGYLEALKKGIVQDDIESTVEKRKKLIATRRESLVGTNQFANSEESVSEKIDELLAFPKAAEEDTLITPINKYRGAIPFEKLRMATEKLPGGKPKVFLLTYGNPAMRKARSSFSANFLACAGYDITDTSGFESAKDGVRAAKEAQADIVVLCSADEEYAELAPEVKDLLDAKTIFVVAGAPACMEELKSKGIENFIHMRSNVLETLADFHEQLGIKI